MFARHTAVIALLSLVGLTAPTVRAQEPDQPQPHGYTAVLDNIDLLIDHYTNFLSRKYELTSEQDAYTRHLLRERAHQFLDQRSDDLRGLIDDLFDVRSGGPMTQEQLIEWGQRAQPIYEEARKLIVDGNMDWREILTPAQQELHDQDLKLMYESFETTEDQLARITSGEMSVEEFRNPRRANRAKRVAARRAARAQAAPPDEPMPMSEEPPPPPDGAGGFGDEPMSGTIASEELRRKRIEARRAQREAAGVDEPPMDEAEEPIADRPPARKVFRRPPPDSPPPPGGKEPARRAGARAAASGKDHESAWDRYVEEFIQRYNLDDAQQQQARTILADCKKQATRYLEGRKSRFERLEQQLAALQAQKDPADAKKRSAEIAELNRQRQEMHEPVARIFEKQLKPRLERIPTRAQRRAAEEAAAKPADRRAGAKKGD